VSSVHGLHRVFPPSDPPVYSRPQLKPPCGICSFTTTTFGAHRGADSSAGRITFGRDLLRQLGGSTSALSPSTSGLLQLPGPTSTRPGRHLAVPDRHRHFWTGIFFPGPALGFLGPTLVGPGQHIYVPDDIGGAGVDSGTPLAGIHFLWPEFTSAGRHISIPTFFGRNLQVLGRHSKISASMGWHSGSPEQAGASSSGWAGSSFIPAGPSRILPYSRFRQAIPASALGRQRWAAPATLGK
jgi:hypothetical protein